MDFNNADVDGLFVNKTAIGSVTSPPKAARIDAALAKRFALVPSPQEQREFRLGVGFHAVVPSVVVYFAEPNTFRIREAIDFAGDVDHARARGVDNRRIKRFQEQLR